MSLRSHTRALGALTLLASGASACVRGATPATDAALGHDSLAPPDAPRAELAFVVDLNPSPSCEEAFDLELYQDRAIERIEWDPRRGICFGRHVTVRFLSATRSTDEVRAAVTSLARRVEAAAVSETIRK